jgi:PGF-pre-PGF domain-containing protein
MSSVLASYQLQSVSSQTVQPSSGAISLITTNAGIYGNNTLTILELDGEPISKYILAKKVYRYIQLSALGSFSGPVSSVVEFSVPKTWLEDTSYAQVRLYQFDTSWKELETTMKKETATGYEFSAVISGFSYLAIALTDTPTSGALIDVTTPAAPSSPTQEQTPVEHIVYALPTPPPVFMSDPIILLLLALLLLVLFSSGVALYYIKRKKKEQPVSTESQATKDARAFVQSVARKDKKVASVLQAIQDRYKQRSPMQVQATAIQPFNSQEYVNTQVQVAQVALPSQAATQMSADHAALPQAKSSVRAIELVAQIEETENTILKKFLSSQEAKKLTTPQIREQLMAFGIRPEKIEMAIDGE